MAELSERSGVPVATIKWWRREGLLPAGRRTAPNQAEYGPEHLARLRLLAVLRDLVDLPTATIAKIVAALDEEDASLHEVVGTAHGALSHDPPAATSDEARAFVDDLLDQLGWQVASDAPSRQELAHTIDALHEFGHDVTVDSLQIHADAAARVARAEVEATQIDQSRDDVVTDVIVGTILYGTILSALRRLAHEDISGRRWSG
jgi:DNA-binding transcriptional MerR regulator